MLYDTSIVEIDENGVLTAISPGKAKITATLTNGEKSFNITVSNRMVNNIKLSDPSKTHQVGDAFRIVSTVTPDNATDNTLTRTVDNSNVAIVSSDGTVVFIGAGTAKITAASVDGSKKKQA